mgnify:CR=1 FL=1
MSVGSSLALSWELVLLISVLSQHEVDDDKLSPPSGWGPLSEDSAKPMKVCIADRRLSIFSSSRAMRASDASAIAAWAFRLRVDSDGSHRFLRRRHLCHILSDLGFNQLLLLDYLPITRFAVASTDTSAFGLVALRASLSIGAALATDCS